MNNFILVESMKEGNGWVTNFLDVDDDNDYKDVNFNVVEVSNNGEQ